jgi:hypothetical protein
LRKIPPPHAVPHMSIQQQPYYSLPTTPSIRNPIDSESKCTFVLTTNHVIAQCNSDSSRTPLSQPSDHSRQNFATSLLSAKAGFVPQTHSTWYLGLALGAGTWGEPRTHPRPRCCCYMPRRCQCGGVGKKTVALSSASGNRRRVRVCWRGYG